MASRPNPLQTLKGLLRRGVTDVRDRGASAVEYGLMVAAIAAVIVGIVFGLGGVVKGVFSSSCTAINKGTACTEAPTGVPAGG
jgi:pilus assembly protein Flp/PilA